MADTRGRPARVQPGSAAVYAPNRLAPQPRSRGVPAALQERSSMDRERLDPRDDRLPDETLRTEKTYTSTDDTAMENEEHGTEAVGAGAGALGGAAVGMAVGGPPGAVVGGLAGAAGG